MKIAIEEARKGISLGHGGPFGAVVVNNDGFVIGRGHNMVVINNDPTAHGEICAIRDACKNTGSFDLSGAVLYTTCYPCPMCLGAILWARIEKVYYCCDSADAEKIGFADNGFYDFFADKNKINKLLALDKNSLKECRNLFEYYNKLTDKTKY